MPRRDRAAREWRPVLAEGVSAVFRGCSAVPRAAPPCCSVGAGSPLVPVASARRAADGELAERPAVT
ncbi:hypothetical protein [Streptomyces sp. NBC_01483]|uniref:hypothetical protein n=1 Tax=Streptomyces sp. NBC_01483 TaxID=2903883 RepID=UPI002E36B603|nr:hypothetical protein [Streptomyces sp. NBC_01483]